MASPGFDRREFIKVAAGIGAGGLAGAVGFSLLQPTSEVEASIVPISYPGLKVIEGSPAPYGLPLIPLEITDAGDLRGRPDAAKDQLAWYKYCGHERAPGTEPSFESDNRLTYFVPEAQAAQRSNVWYGDQLGEAVNVADFPEEEPSERFGGYPGVGAPVRWRSEGVEPGEMITAIVIKAPANRLEADGVTQPPSQEILDDWMPRDPERSEMRYLACCSFCTHFCCVPGFHTSQTAIDSDAGGKIFCSCHFSEYEPFTVAQYNRNIFVFPEGEQAPSDTAQGAP